MCIVTIHMSGTISFRHAESDGATFGVIPLDAAAVTFVAPAARLKSEEEKPCLVSLSIVSTVE